MAKSEPVRVHIQRVRELLDKEKRLKHELDVVIQSREPAVYQAARALHDLIFQATGASMPEEALKKAVIERAQQPPEKAADCPLAGHSGTIDSCKECV